MAKVKRKAKPLRIAGFVWQSVNGGQFGFDANHNEMKKLRRLVPNPNDDISVWLTIEPRAIK